MVDTENNNLKVKVEELELRLEESEQLIEAIKAGEVDAFAINSKNNKSEIYTLQSGDYAYRILIEEFGEGALNVTEEGLIVYTNPYFLKLMNLPYEKVIGSFIFDFIHPDSRKEFQQLFKKAHSGKCKGEVFLLDDKVIPVYISLTSLQPNLATIGIIVSDLTEKKKSEQTILEYQKNLETKNKELIKSNAELASFAYIASHDLQEPLRKIQTFATRIEENEGAHLEEAGKEYLKKMQESAVRMRILIDDLLTYSRTNTLERKFENTNLNTVMEEVKDDLKEELDQMHAKVHASKLCTAKIIPFQFRQLLHNLITNSLKFSKQDIPPYIEIKSKIVLGKQINDEKLLPEMNYCHLTVTDNGIGFEQKYNKQIFDMFQRLHGKSEYKGTGIGLAIVKKIVENHNGTISATGEPGKGATFNIYIPA